MSIRLSALVMTKISKEIIPRWEKAVADIGKRTRQSRRAKERYAWNMLHFTTRDILSTILVSIIWENVSTSLFMDQILLLLLL